MPTETRTSETAMQRFRQSWNPPPHTFTQQRGSWIYPHGACLERTALNTKRPDMPGRFCFLAR
jgi:hypothetical protein